MLNKKKGLVPERAYGSLIHIAGAERLSGAECLCSVMVVCSVSWVWVYLYTGVKLIRGGYTFVKGLRGGYTFV